MHTVTVVFVNGNIVSFKAQEFDVEFKGQQPGFIAKHSYKNAAGEESSIYLKSSEVAGAFLTRSVSSSASPVTYTVPGKG